jgi:hypothetical protein
VLRGFGVWYGGTDVAGDYLKKCLGDEKSPDQYLWDKIQMIIMKIVYHGGASPDDP